jgi:hypothetical protein
MFIKAFLWFDYEWQKRNTGEERSPPRKPNRFPDCQDGFRYKAGGTPAVRIATVPVALQNRPFITYTLTAYQLPLQSGSLGRFMKIYKA